METGPNEFRAGGGGRFAVSIAGPADRARTSGSQGTHTPNYGQIHYPVNSNGSASDTGSFRQVILLPGMCAPFQNLRLSG